MKPRFFTHEELSRLRNPTGVSQEMLQHSRRLRGETEILQLESDYPFCRIPSHFFDWSLHLESQKRPSGEEVTGDD